MHVPRIGYRMRMVRHVGVSGRLGEDVIRRLGYDVSGMHAWLGNDVSIRLRDDVRRYGGAGVRYVVRMGVRIRPARRIDRVPGATSDDEAVP